MKSVKISRKKKERLDEERANYVDNIERVRKEKKAEYLLKLREKQMVKKGTVERERRAYSSSFEHMETKDLREKKQMYERMKNIAEGNSNELLVHHCEDMLKEIEIVKKRKG